MADCLDGSVGVSEFRRGNTVYSILCRLVYSMIVDIVVAVGHLAFNQSAYWDIFNSNSNSNSNSDSAYCLDGDYSTPLLEMNR